MTDRPTHQEVVVRRIRAHIVQETGRSYGWFNQSNVGEIIRGDSGAWIIKMVFPWMPIENRRIVAISALTKPKNIAKEIAELVDGLMKVADQSRGASDSDIIYNFLDLPYPRRIRLLIENDLLEGGDAEINHADLIKQVIGRLKARKFLEKFSVLVQQERMTK